MVSQRDLFDETVRHRIALERYSTTQVRQVLRYLLTVEKDLTGKIAAAGIEGLNVKQQEAMLKSVRELYADAYETLLKKLNKDFAGLSKAEAEFQKGYMKKAAKVDGFVSEVGAGFTFQNVSVASAYAVAKAKPLQGRFLEDWLDDLEPSHVQRVEEQLRISFTEGESTSKAIARIRDVSGINRRGAEAIVRTANTHISTAISDEVYEKNKKVLKGWQFVATLDSRTTLICAGLDGNVYKVGEGPRPPRHIRCRSTTMPVILGVKPVGRESYESWLKRQSAEVQDDILGPTRGDLYRKGKFDVERFTDAKGKTLTLEQLKS